MLLSGVGPAQELIATGIQPVHELPGIGKNLQDHCALFITDLVDSVLSPKGKFALDTASVNAAKEEWERSRTGPFTEHHASVVMALLRDEQILDTNAFKSLDIETQRHIRDPGVPMFEVASVS